MSETLLSSQKTIQTQLLQLLPLCLSHLNQTNSWESLRDNFPTLIKHLALEIPSLIHKISIEGERCHSYSRQVLWIHDDHNPLKKMSLIGFVFTLNQCHVLNIHLYNAINNPNKTIFETPPAFAKDRIVTPIHNHHCQCLSHIVWIDPRLKVVEHFYEDCPTHGLTQRFSVERTPSKANLDNAKTSYIHQLEISSI